jgi:hypothetical protein
MPPAARLEEYSLPRVPPASPSYSTIRSCTCPARPTILGYLSSPGMGFADLALRPFRRRVFARGKGRITFAVAHNVAKQKGVGVLVGWRRAPDSCWTDRRDVYTRRASVPSFRTRIRFAGCHEEVREAPEKRYDPAQRGSPSCQGALSGCSSSAQDHPRASAPVASTAGSKTSQVDPSYFTAGSSESLRIAVDTSPASTLSPAKWNDVQPYACRSHVVRMYRQVSPTGCWTHNLNSPTEPVGGPRRAAINLGAYSSKTRT